MKICEWLNTGIFEANVMFTVGMNHADIMMHLKNKKIARDWSLGISEDEKLIDNNNAWGFGLRRIIFNKANEKTLFYIIIKRFDFKNDDHYCRLAHEILHICQFLLPDILNRDREFECEAYLHTHLMRQCLKAMRQ